MRPTSAASAGSKLAPWIGALLAFLILLRPFWKFLLDGFARKHLVAYRRVIHKICDDDRHLPHIVELQPIVNVHIGVMGAGIVFNWILDELESGDPDRIEGQVVRASSITHGQ